MKKQLMLNNQMVEVEIVSETASFVLFNFDGEEYSINLESSRNGRLVLGSLGKNYPVQSSGDSYVVSGRELNVALPSQNRKKNKAVNENGMIAPMPGKILKIFKVVGDKVSLGDPILVMEAMKMEHTIKAAANGTIEKLFYKEGDQVPAKVELVKIC
jgi:3-methylcrotonyl-CoA carboxylase alpha subunit